MKFMVTRKELSEGLQVVSRTVSGNTSLPVLKNVLIEPGTDAIKLSATDLELAVEVLVSARVAEGGALTVPAKTLADIVSALPEADVAMELEDVTDLVLRCRRSVLRVRGLSAEEFPPLPEVGGSIAFQIPQPVMKEMIRQTSLAASDDDTRPILTGINLVLTHDQLRLVATDTHRLALRSAPVTEASGERTVIVPARALNELLRVLRDDEPAPLYVRIDQNQILFRTERVTLISRLIEGQFPKYERVIPTAYTRRITVQRDELASCLRRTRIVARDATAKDRVVLSVEGESLILEAEGEGGKSREELEIAREGEEISIAFNAAYLSDVLGVIDSEGIFLDLTEPLSPGVVRPIDGGDYLMVLMPMQLQ
jgi:DNA polymerase III subunit beta